jgi:hypothetical protein
MKKQTFIFIVITLFFKTAGADTPFGLETVFIGANYSIFRHTNGRYRLGVGIGFQGETVLTNFSFFSWGVFYNTKGGILPGKYIQPINSAKAQEEPNFISDIHVHVSFLEFPIHLNFLLPLAKSHRLSIYSGPQICFPLKYSTELKNRKTLPKNGSDLSYPPPGRFTYQTNPYVHYDDKGIKLGYDFGLAYHYRDITLDLRYSYLKHKLESGGQIRSLYKKMYAFQLFLGYHF